MVVLTQRIAVKTLVDIQQLLDRGGRLFHLLQDRLVVRHQILGIGVEDIGHQHRIVGHRGPARFGDDVGTFYAGFLADVLDLVDHVVGVLFHRVIDAGKVAGLGAVIIHPQTATNIEVLDIESQLAHLGVDPGRFDQGGFDLVDLGDLTADVRVQQINALQHLCLFQHPDGRHDFGHPQAKLGILAAGGGPFAGSLGGKLDPNPQQRLDAGFFGQFDDLFQLEQLLHHDGDGVADLGGVQHGLDILGILVAVADDRQTVAGGNGDAGHQLRLGTDLQTDVVALAVAGDRLNHLTLLVDLDRIEGLILGRVVVFCNGAAENPVDGGDPALQHIHESQQDRRLDLALDQVIHQHPQVDGVLGVGRRMNADVSLFVNGKQISAPVVDVVDLGGFID